MWFDKRLWVYALHYNILEFNLYLFVQCYTWHAIFDHLPSVYNMVYIPYIVDNQIRDTIIIYFFIWKIKLKYLNVPLKSSTLG